VRKLTLVVLAAAAVVGLVRSILDSYFTTRVVELPPPPAASWPATVSRVALVVLDGLRPTEAFSPEHMPALAARRQAAAWGVARSSEITMTVPGVRMLGAGVSSDFMEILHNWDPRASRVTSLFAVARQKGLRTLVYGDHAWKRVFTSDIERHVDVGVDRWTYYADPMHTPDLAHLAHVREWLATRQPFDLLVIHLVGPDHASHRHRVTTREYRDYTRWLDPRVDELLRELLATGATVLVTSDHGMSDGGQHGGDEATARQTPYLWQGPGIKVGAGPWLSQADLPATLAALLGLPLPPFGEGRVAREVLAAPPDAILAMMSANVAQAHTYLRCYERQYGRVPRALLDRAPDLNALAARQGMASALAAADDFLGAYRSERRTVDKSVGRTWAWLCAIVAVALLVLLPGAPSPLPRGALALSGLALAVSLGSWVTTALLWPAVACVLLACLPHARGVLAGRRLSLRSGATLGLGGLLVVGLFALAHVGYQRQFRSATMLGDLPESYVRAAAYVLVLLGGVLLFRWRRRAAAGTRYGDLALLVPFLVMVPSGKLLLVLSPGLGLGLLWLLRLVRITEERPRLTGVELFESYWFLFVASLCWLALESWAPMLAPIIDRQRGVLGWTLHRAPWLLAPALVYQLARSRETGTRRALALVALGLTLPPLLFAHQAEYFNLLAGLALLAMVVAAINRRSMLGTFQLGAATYALTRLLGSPANGFTLLVVCGTYWIFLSAPSPAPPPSTEKAPPALRPLLTGLCVGFVWLTVQELREGSFSFSDLEVTVGFYGNPTHDIGRGALQVSARFILPMVLLLLPLRWTAVAPRVLGVVVALLLLHIAFLLVGFLATQSQFYTPYRLAGELVHFIAVVGSLPLLFLLFGLRPANG
jgi:hypothetical protein